VNWIISLITGPILGQLTEAYKARLAAGNTGDRLAVDLAARELEVQQRERELQTQILIAEQGNWFTRSIRPLWALPFVLFTFKVVVYDKMFGLGTTDALDPNMWNVFMAMVVAYFGGRSAEKVATTVAAVFKKR
jgi:hypothetical protein